MATIEKRTAKSGETTYRVRVRVKGYKPASATFERLTDARRWEQQTEAAMREGRYFKNTEAKKRTLAEMIDRYLEQVGRNNPRRWESVHLLLEWWKRELGYVYLSDLTRSKITEKRDQLLATPKKDGTPRMPATVNRHTEALRHALNMAVKEWEWLESHPMNGLPKLKEPRGRDRFLTDEERQAILAACQASKSKNLFPLVMLALTTGARAGELLNIRWQDIDFPRSQIVLHKTKNGEKRVLHLLPAIKALLEEHGKVRRLGTDLLFPAARNPKVPFEYRPSWEYALQTAGIENFRFHDLRHTAASYLAMSSASLMEISACLGHKTLAMVKRYAHLSDASTASAVQRMNERILQL